MKKLFALGLTAAMLLSLPLFVTAEEEDFATVEALQFDREPDIDGKVSVEEWGQPTIAHIRYPENPQSDISDDDNTDVELTLWFRYTFDGFYVAAQTPDSSPCNDNVDNQNIWNGDCLQMRLDPEGCTVDQGLFPSESRDANFSEDYQEFAFAYSSKDQQCYAYCWHGVMNGMALSSEGGRYGATNDGTTTTYEVFIPWDELVYENPHVGTSYGIAAALLTATEGENDNKWQNWLEWGCGVINKRNDNICGTNRLVMSDKTVFGGSSLTDPDPLGEVTTRAPIPEAQGDAVIIDFSKLSNARNMSGIKNNDGSVTFIFDESNDPFVTVGISSQIKLQAEDYPYFAMYLTTNYADANGEFFYTTTEGVREFSGGYSVKYEYMDVEGGQVVVVDFSDAPGYEGYVLNLRFDAYDGGTSDPDEAEITVYSAGFFKNYEDAVVFRADGVDVELDPEYLAEIGEDNAETTLEETDAKDETTDTADDTVTDTEAPVAEPTTTAETTGADVKPATKSGNSWIIFVAVGAAAAAAVAIAVIVIKKKK